jgi:TetR/AcrR family transcriptional regulator of autoinduction and epiphytic fitness
MSGEIGRYPLRAARAAETRKRIVLAATASFVERGYPAATMAGIADDAGVAVQTLYASFKTKRAILAAAIDIAIAGDDEPVPVNERPWMRPVWAATDGPATVRAYASAVRMIQSRTAELFRALDVASASEPELHDLWRVSRERRRMGAGGVVRAAAERSPLRRDVSIDKATDIVWTFNGHDLYLNLLHGCGWSPAAYEEWLGNALAELLFGPDD